MKRFIFFGFITFFFLPAAFCQIKNLKATQQKTFAGMGGIFMNYLIDFSIKKEATIEIDSVKTIADSASIKFGFTKFDPCCKNEISFSYALSQSTRCGTCPKVPLQQYDVTKGVIIYYRNGEKKSSFKIKKFKQLPDLMSP